MTVGRILTQGYGVFGGRRYVPTLGLGVGEAVVVTPNDGWTAESRSRLLVSESRLRTIVPESRNRVWVAEERNG